MQLLQNIWAVLAEAAPWLLIGLVAAGLIKSFIPTDWMSRWLGKKGIGSVVRAALIGTPLPLCSCGVLPAALGLRRAGASKGATVSFLVATPENGADSLAMTYAMLGPFMTIVRPVAALFSAISGGILAELAPENSPTPLADKDEKAASGCCASKAKEPPAASATESCCAKKTDSPSQTATATAANATSCCGKAAVEPAPAPAKESCCSKTEPSSATVAASPSPSIAQRCMTGLRFSLTDVLDDIKVWLMVGIVAAAAIRTFVPDSFLIEYGQGWSAMFIMLLIGLPMYICATASTPVAGAFLLAGVSPGAVIVFLLAGPATNIGTIMVVKRELGIGPLAGYLTGVCGGALVSGFVVNLIVASQGLDLPSQAEHVHRIVPLWLEIGAACLLILAMIRPLRSMVLPANGNAATASPLASES